MPTPTLPVLVRRKSKVPDQAGFRIWIEERAAGARYDRLDYLNTLVITRALSGDIHRVPVLAVHFGNNRAKALPS